MFYHLRFEHSWFSAMYGNTRPLSTPQGPNMEKINSGFPLLVNTNHFVVEGYMQAFTYQPILNISLFPKVNFYNF